MKIFENPPFRQREVSRFSATEGLTTYCFAVKHYKPNIASASLWVKPLFLPQSGIHSPLCLKMRADKMKVLAINNNAKRYGHTAAALGMV